MSGRAGRVWMVVAVIVGAVLVAQPGTVAASAPAELAKLEASDGFADDTFGTSVASSGGTIVVGAPRLTDTTWEPGRAYVYTPAGAGSYVELALSASDGTNGDSFGASVAIDSTTIVVGAPLQDVALDAAGAAYVYTPDGLGGYDELRLTASDPETHAHFGQSVAIAGGTIVVGATSDDGGATNAGSLYVFTPDGLGGYDELKLTASAPAASDGLGRSIALSGDTIVASASRTFAGQQNAGAMYVFTPNGLGGYDELVLGASDAAPYDNFGDAVAMSGDTIVAGAPGDDGEAGAVYVFTPDGVGGYDETKLTASDRTAGHRFGDAVALSGGTVVAGSPLDDVDGFWSGSAYAFRPDGLGGYGEAKLRPSDAGENRGFGGSVAVDGDQVLVGASGIYLTPWPGAVYLFGATQPGAPTILRNATAGDGEATVSWLAPESDGWSPITGYIVTPYIGFSPQPSTTFASTATTQVVTGLTNGVEYRFRVRAVNAVGPSGYSTVTNPVYPNPDGLTAPDPPTILRNATAGDGVATVSWLAPTSDGGTAITGYIVTPYVGFSPQPSTTFASTATTQVVTGLTNGVEYRFRVRAINAVGIGGYSTVTNPVTPTA